MSQILMGQRPFFCFYSRYRLAKSAHKKKARNSKFEKIINSKKEEEKNSKYRMTKSVQREVNSC